MRILVYLFGVAILTGLLVWQLGANAWVVLISILLILAVFGGIRFVKPLTGAVYAAIIAILLLGFAHSIAIDKSGLSDEFLSFWKDKNLKMGIDLENPAVDLQARAKGLINDSAAAELKKNFNDFDSLLNSAQNIKNAESKLYNSLHDKFSTSSQVAQSDQEDRMINQVMSGVDTVLNLKDFVARKNGDTTFFYLMLSVGQSLSVKLADSAGQMYAYRIDFGNDLLAVSPNQKYIFSLSQKRHNFWQQEFLLTPCKGPAAINLKLWPYKP